MTLKGQSSIEYMTTYGWMLVVVAIATGIFYTNYVPEKQCRQRMTNEMANQLQVADMATDSQGDLTLLVRNLGAHKATVKQIKASNGGNTTVLDTNVSMDPVEEKVFRINGTVNTESCNEVDLRITFNSSEIGEVVDEGTVQGRFTVG